MTGRANLVREEKNDPYRVEYKASTGYLRSVQLDTQDSPHRSDLEHHHMIFLI